MLSNRKGTSQAIIFFILASACFLIGVYYLLESSQTEITLLDEVTPLSIAEPAAALRLSVSESGIVALSDSILKKAGLRVSSFSDNGMSITHNGRQIPLLVLQEGEKNKHLYFYAEHQTEDPPSIYLLEPNQGKSMGLRDGRSTGEETTIGTQHRRWETKELLLPNTTGTDNWFSDQIVPEYPLILELLDVKPERAQPATLTLSLWGITDIVHQVELSINEKLLDTLSWQGATGGTFTVTIPPYTLNPTKNELTLTLSDTSQKQTTIYLDWVELHYSSELKLSPNKQLSFYSSAKNFTLSGNGTNAQTFIFDVSNSAEPIFLSNLKEKSELLHVSGNSFGLNSHYIAIKTSQAIVPKIDSIFRTQLNLNAENEADYVAILSPIEGVEKAIEPLLKAREAEGLKTLAIPARAIYYEFGGGVADAEALKKFILYTSKWKKKPRYILLVGDGNNDWRNGEDADAWSAPWLPIQLESSTDGLIANDQSLSLNGIAIGRWPVRTVADVQTLVTKTLSFGTTPPLTQAVFIENPPNSFVTNLLTTNHYTITTTPLDAPTIVSNLQKGVRLWNYDGKGDRRAWGEDRSWSVTDLPTLSNATYPILSVLSAPTGYFFHPQEHSLAEEMLWQTNGGIVAAVAASGNVSADLVQQATQTFYSYLLQGETIGTAWQQTRASYSDPTLSAINVLGDPALRLPIER